MKERGRVLLADDEDHFRLAVAELLREEGYDCALASDAAEAMARLEAEPFDVLVADIKMPGNLNLEFIREAAEKAPHMSVILVTGYPSTETAIASVNLPVTAYLTKPFRFEALLGPVAFGVERSRAFAALERLRRQTRTFDQVLAATTTALENATDRTFADPLNVFLESLYHNILTSLSEMKRVTGMLASPDHAAPADAFPDPRIDVLRDALEEVVRVLKKTKTAFKSKDLAQLRRRVEGLIEQMDARVSTETVAPER